MTKLNEELKKYLKTLESLEEDAWSELAECKEVLGSHNVSTRIATARWGEIFEHYHKLKELLDIYGEENE